jgi:hypothetical protein
MSELQTHDELEAGDQIEFEYTTKLMDHRATKTGEVVEVGGDVVKVEVDDADPFEGDSDVFALIGDPGHLKDVFYVRHGQPDTFCGDRARISRPSNPTDRTPTGNQQTPTVETV